MQRDLRTNSKLNSHRETNGSEFVLLEGELVLLSSELYSDYGYSGPFRCTREFDLSEIADELEADPEHRHGPNSLVLHLLETGFIEKLHCREVHLGTYGNLNLSKWIMNQQSLIDDLEFGFIDEPEYKVTSMQFGL
ncbi:hypothetical protein YA0599_03370 [Pseudomonas syringae]|uniref:hypothetical protein n=1 Tax=Pseudomonas syringae TaxID=317 RepID=UPI0018E5E251|nr:hypothetical protein [Pseudomonas syringae]MBI6707254.1 hypothetical protein [Pseudomonas syringae]